MYYNYYQYYIYYYYLVIVNIIEGFCAGIAYIHLRCTCSLYILSTCIAIYFHHNHMLIKN